MIQLCNNELCVCDFCVCLQVWHQHCDTSWFMGWINKLRYYRVTNDHKHLRSSSQESKTSAVKLWVELLRYKLSDAPSDIVRNVFACKLIVSLNAHESSSDPSEALRRIHFVFHRFIRRAVKKRQLGRRRLETINMRGDGVTWRGWTEHL